VPPAESLEVENGSTTGPRKRTGRHVFHRMRVAACGDVESTEPV